MVLVKINQLGIIREVGSLVCLLARSRPMLTKYSKLFLLQFLKISFQNSSRPEGISWALEKIRFLTSWLSQVLTSFETPGTPLRNIRKMRLLSEKCWLKLIFKSLESLIHVNPLKTNFHQLFSKLINDPVTDQSFHLADRGALLWSPNSSSPIFLRKTCGFQKYKVKDYANTKSKTSVALHDTILKRTPTNPEISRFRIKVSGDTVEFLNSDAQQCWSVV